MSLRTIKRRRRECKTDYKLRFGLLKSSLPRIAIRRTNKYIILQAIESSEAQDKVIAGVTSRDLLDHGWDEKTAGSLKSIPACYLAGMLLAKKLNGGQYILDMGMAINHAGGRMYAAAKGLVDGGLKINLGEKVIPSKEKLDGENVKEEAKKMIAKVKATLSDGSIASQKITKKSSVKEKAK
jgi:large subunit ribosomal protein L18